MFVAPPKRLDPYLYAHERDALVEHLMVDAMTAGCPDVTAHWRLAGVCERHDRSDEAIALCERAASIPGLGWWKAEVLLRRLKRLKEGAADDEVDFF